MQPEKKENGRGGFYGVTSTLVRRRLVVVRGEKPGRVVVSLSLLYCLAALLLAPHLALLSALCAALMKYRFRIREDASGATPEDVERFVGRAADGVRRAGDRLSEKFSGRAGGQDRRDGRADFEDDW